MKRKSTRRLVTAFLSLFLVCICLATVFAFPVSAAAASSDLKTDYKTTDKKPTYTETLNRNNELLNKLSKKENSVLKYVKENNREWVSDAFSIANAVKNSNGEDVDWEKIGAEAVKKLLNSLPGQFALLGTVAEGIEMLTSSGAAPLSEVQVLSDDMTQQFNAMSDHLYDIEDKLGSLSNEVIDSANTVLSGTANQINNLQAKQILRSFMSSGEGNFSYIEYSNYLYGNKNNSVNISEAYYILLLEAIHSGASEETIDYYYDKLFDSLYSNIHIYNQYYYGDVAGLDKSMAAYYYDYLSYNPDLVREGSTAEYEALLFALDLYTTYVYSYEILEICYAHQVTEMYFDADAKGVSIESLDVRYNYAGNKTITYSTIQDELTDAQAKLVNAEEQIAKDIAYILGMEDSYIVVDENGDIHSIGNYGSSYGNVANGQVVYLNVIPDEICDLFALNLGNVKYFVNGTEYLAADKGIIDSDDYIDTFTACVQYGNTELYNIQFTKIDNTSITEFSGGSGTIDDPYLISNATQFYMVQDDLDASYQLISDIVVTGTHSPIGTEKKPFNGTFDGNGYSISNLVVESLEYDSTNITMTPTTGMFGTIGRTGVVKNLTLNAVQIISDYQYDAVSPENDTSYYYVGGIAGVNRGIVSNCSITDYSTITVNRMKQTQDSRTVMIYVGGIVGENSGIIEYCSTDGLSIEADSHLYYYNESTSSNQHALYVGGIVASSSNTIQYCRVSENSTISAYAKSIADSKDREKPILTVYAGGIVASDSGNSILSNVYSDCKILECKGEIYNEGTYWGKHRYSWDNVTIKQGPYYPTFFPLSASNKLDDFEMNFFKTDYTRVYNKEHSRLCYEQGYPEYDSPLWVQNEAEEIALTKTKHELVEKSIQANSAALKELECEILASYDDTAFTFDNARHDIHIELSDNVCDINATNLTDYFNKLVDEENGITNIRFVNGNGETVEATVVAYYGFYTYNEFVETQAVIVKVFFYVDDILMSDDVKLTIKGNELVGWEIKDFIDEPFSKGSNGDSCLDKIFEDGFEIWYYYSNGTTEKCVVNSENRNDVVISNFSTAEAGDREIEIIHLHQPAVGSVLRFKETVSIKCPHSEADFEHISTVSATCIHLGYEEWECQLCGEKINKNYKKGFHNYIVTDGVGATCHEAGYTQEVSCSVCGEIFESSEWIQVLPHNYAYGVEDGAHPKSEYHYCSNGNHYEAHQYTVTESVDNDGTLVYIYTCSTCGYQNPVKDYNIITNERGEKPVVLVTNGYVLNVGDEVVVYVQVINNPGFKGATFGVRYTDGLELIAFDESTIVPQQLKVSNEVYNGYNYLWAEGDGNVTTEDGYLLKLTFKYVSEAKDEQNISIVYGMSNGSEGGFCALNDEYHKFLTQNGMISVVDHLPGDVNNDAIVDIMDATYIAWHIVGKEDGNGNKIRVNAKYADVNLDGKVDLLDVIAILQSISGRYGTSLLNSEYKLFFELNGFECAEMDESVTIEFYDDDGIRNTWEESIRFEEYKALMKQLGYTFDGWYTRLVDGELVAVDADKNGIPDYVIYDKYQSVQTLYAHWVKNKISFDVNGYDGEPVEEIVYERNEHANNPIIILPTLTWSYDAECLALGTEESETIKYSGRIYKEFIGWENENGEIVTEIDISQPGAGLIKLTAKWSEDYTWESPTFKVDGYEIKDWYLDSYCKIHKITQDTSWDMFKDSLIANNYQVYAQQKATEYSITYENLKGAANANKDVYTIESPKIILSDITTYGYTFDGWYIGENKITEIPKYSTGDIVLTARWTPITYTIVYENSKGATNSNKVTYTIEDNFDLVDLPNVKGYTFAGWYNSLTGGVEIESVVAGQGGNRTFYAMWTPIVYTITYENTKGVNNSNPVTYTIEDEVVFKNLPNDVEGYVFGGWYTTADGDGKVGKIERGSIGNKIYYAKWTENGYSITYHNIYNAQNPNPDSYTIESETIIFATPYRAGYTFGGWYTDSVFKNAITEIPTGSCSNVDIYAKWSVISYSINYELYGGVNNSNNPQNYTIESSEITLKNPNRSGYTFNGWYTDSTYETAITSVSTGSHGNIKVYAKWTPINYSITYNLNGGTNDVNNPASYTIETSTITLKDPTRTGYKFNGWNEGNTIAKGSTGNKPFTAKWSAIPYKITLDLNGGEDYAVANPTTYTIEDNLVLNNPKGRPGYEFIGWKLEGGDGVPYKQATIFPRTTGDKSYIAVWEGKEYNIKYDLNSTTDRSKQDSGMSYSSFTWKDESSNDKIIYGTNGTQLDIPESPYYKFDGWYTASTGGTRITDGNGKIVNSTQFISDLQLSGTTLYAHWKKVDEYIGYSYIKTAVDLKNIAQNPSGKFVIIDNISLSGTWTPIESFSGTLDGDGHCVYNFTISKTGGSGSATLAFIKKNTGIIKDFIIGKTGIKTYDSKYSVKYDISYTESGSASSLTVGGLVAENSGTITGCKLINTYINATIADNDNDENLDLYVGGIATNNTGTISNCFVESSTIEANAIFSKRDSGDNNYAWLGGICGKNSGTVNQCTVKNTTFKLYVDGDGYNQLFSPNRAYPEGVVGVIVGEQLNTGKTTSSTVSGNTVKSVADTGDDNTVHRIYYNNILYENSGDKTFTDNAKCGRNTDGVTVS